jgi:single stranded DNA-binding protein
MSYHKITVIGYAGSEPDHQVTANGKNVANFPLYVNERYGEEERAIRYKVKAWGNLSQVVLEHLRKGQLLVVDGVPAVEVWQDKTGEPRAQLVVTAQALRFLGSKPETMDEEDEDGDHER